jgi:lipoate-protein ligase B
MRRVAEEMGKQPEDFQKYVSILEENMIDTVESLGLLTEA